MYLIINKSHIIIIVRSTYSVVAQISTSPAQCVVLSADSNGNHDSGYAPNTEETVAVSSTPPATPHRNSIDSGTIKNVSAGKRNGIDDSPKREPLR